MSKIWKNIYLNFKYQFSLFHFVESDVIVSPSTYSCRLVIGWLSESFIVSDFGDSYYRIYHTLQAFPPLLLINVTQNFLHDRSNHPQTKTWFSSLYYNLKFKKYQEKHWLCVFFFNYFTYLLNSNLILFVYFSGLFNGP